MAKLPSPASKAQRKVPVAKVKKSVGKRLPRRPAPKRSPGYLRFWEKLKEKHWEYVPTTVSTRIGRKHGITREQSERLENGISTRNWCGVVYDTPGTNYTRVCGTWTIPIESCPLGATDGTTYYCSIWIGIGGMNHDVLVQAGTEFEFIAMGGAVTNAKLCCWYEIVPGAEQQDIEGFPVIPGDGISVVISYNASNAQYSGYFMNHRTGQNTYQPIAIPGGNLLGNSVEWMVERPKLDGVNQPLADFTKIVMVDLLASEANGTELQGGAGELMYMTLDDQVTTIAEVQSDSSTEISVNYV